MNKHVMNLEGVKGGETIKVFMMIFICFCLKMTLKLIKRLYRLLMLLVENKL